MDNWHVLETKFNAKDNRSLETVYTIGNGYLGTRGTFEEGYPDEQPATLINGLYDDVPIAFSELVNTPNWVDLQIIANGHRLNLKTAKYTDYFRDLNMQNGELTRSLCWQVPAGGQLRLEFTRFVSLADQHVVAIRCQVTSIDFSGEIEFQSELSGHVDNEGFLHLDWVDQGKIGDHSAYLQLVSRKTRVTLAEAFTLKLLQEKAGSWRYCNTRWSPTWVVKVRLEPQDQTEIEKIVTIFTSLDGAHPKKSALNKLEQVGKKGYATLLAESAAQWRKEWEASNIIIKGDDEAERAVRFAVYQLLIAAPRKNDRVSIPAKSLSGFGYRGHIFWDTEIFVLPFFIYTQPEIARRLLMYRYHTLPAARQKARMNHYEGAQFAWESAATGEENTPRWAPLPDGNLVRIWCGDIEHHINSDIAYAVRQYWQVTSDNAFMRDYGAEIILETARFWNSRVEWDEENQRFHIDNVIGPDEYHECINNNAYTNNFARWNLQFGLEVLDWLRTHVPEKALELEQRLELTPQKLIHWQLVIDRIYLGFDPVSGLYEQFEDFFKLKKIDLHTFEPRNASIQALLGIKKTQEYQILKQPDVLMMLYLLENADSEEIIIWNFNYYTPITDSSFGSSLGPPIQSIMAARVGDIKTAYDMFGLAAKTDLGDIRGNSADGIHIATQGGLWQSVIFGFAGVRLSPDGPVANQKFPPGWKAIHFNITVGGKKHRMDIYSGGEPALPLRGVIFDLDGMITDTSDLHYQAWKRLAEEEGILFTRKDNEDLRGIPRRESLLRILKGRKANEAEIRRMMNRKNQYYRESISSLTEDNLLPGSQDLLECMKAAGIKIALGSASKNARAVVEKLKIADLFDAIADGSSVSQQKPAPDLFIHAASQLDVPTNYCAVFEDAAAGIEAALTAGMWAIGIGPQERLKDAHVVYPGLDHITLEDLINHLSDGSKP